MAKETNTGASESTTAASTEQQKTEPEVKPTRNFPRKIEFPDIVGYGIAGCMRSRDHVTQFQNSMDDWFRTLPADKTERVRLVDEARTQMETSRLAIEAIYTRFRQLATSAKA